MEVGKLYSVNRYFWLYPSQDSSEEALAIAFPNKDGAIGSCMNETPENIKRFVEYLNKALNCNVSYVEPSSLFVLLEQDEEYCKILTTNGSIGWIICPDIEEYKDWRIKEVNE